MSKRVVHNDLKPGNVMITTSGDVRIIDWGLACKAYNNYWSSKGNLAGTFQYMSPEQAQTKQTGPPTDWFACGAIFYEGLTRKLIHGDHLSVSKALLEAASFSDKRWRAAAEEIGDLGYPEFVKPFRAATNPVEMYRTLEPLAQCLAQYRGLSTLG